MCIFTEKSFYVWAYTLLMYGSLLYYFIIL
eukprot:UN01896